MIPQTREDWEFYVKNQATIFQKGPAMDKCPTCGAGGEGVRYQGYALSVKQPWANMIASGEKTIETRTWCAPHWAWGDDLLICASARPRIAPAGCAVALVTLVGCEAMTAEDETSAGCKAYPGAWSWFLTSIRRVVPVPVKGRLGIFKVDLELEVLP